jgi:hypothetical protein
MRRSSPQLAPLSLGIAALALIVSCASAPPPEPLPEPAPQPVQKERIVTYQVPVLSKETVYYPDGLVDVYTSYAWDEARIRLLSKSTFDSSRPEALEKVVYEYEAGGLPSAEQSYGSDGLLKSRKEFSWTGSKPRLLAAERGLDAKGQAQWSSSYEYDASGRRTAWKAFDSRGALKATTLYAYDASGALSLITLKNEANAVTGSIEVARAGEVETRSYKAPDGSVQKRELFRYAGQNLLRFEIRRADGSLAEATDYSYGQLGELVATVVSDGSGKVKERRQSEYLLREAQKVEIYFE